LLSSRGVFPHTKPRCVPPYKAAVCSPIQGVQSAVCDAENEDEKEVEGLSF
jgi:hypothetical protein